MDTLENVGEFIREKVCLEWNLSRINTPKFSKFVILHNSPPMKMEQTVCTETSTYKIQTPGNYPEGSIQHSEHGESLKSRLLLLILNSVLNSAHDLSSCNVLNRPTCIHACIRTLMCLWEYSLIYIKIVRHVLQDWRSFFQEVQAFCVVTQSSRVIYSWDFEAIIFRGSGIGLFKTFGLWPPTVLSTALLHCVITR